MDYREHRLAYCEFLISSQISYSQTYMAEHHKSHSHDSVNRFLKLDVLIPRILWENVSGDVVMSEKGYLLFDDTVLDKRHSRVSRLIRKQWSGNAKKVIYGVGVVTCVYVNPDLDQFWVIDYRVYDHQGDGQSKIDHMLEMLDNVHDVKKLPFAKVLMDTWYASVKVIKHIEKLNKIDYCPSRENRLVDDSDGKRKHQAVNSLLWTDDEEQTGKLIHLNKMPKGHRVKLFRLASSTRRTDFVISNDKTQDDVNVVKQELGIRWTIEQFHREAKQVSGIEGFQYRLDRSIRNHIACAMLVWVQLKRLAQQSNTPVYQLKFSLLDDYIRQQLKNPSIPMALC